MNGKEEKELLSHITMHRRKNIWGENVDKFDPRKSSGVEIQWYETYEPLKDDCIFHGVHHCPAERIAFVFVEIALAFLIDRNAEILGTIPPVSFERAALAQRLSPIPILCRKKLD